MSTVRYRKIYACTDIAAAAYHVVRVTYGRQVRAGEGDLRQVWGLQSRTTLAQGEGISA